MNKRNKYKRKKLKEAVEFINKVGGITYYENINVDSLQDTEVSKEIKDVKFLFKNWIKEFEWEPESELSFMKAILESSKL